MFYRTNYKCTENNNRTSALFFFFYLSRSPDENFRRIFPLSLFVKYETPSSVGPYSSKRYVLCKHVTCVHLCALLRSPLSFESPIRISVSRAPVVVIFASVPRNLSAPIANCQTSVPRRSVTAAGDICTEEQTTHPWTTSARATEIFPAPRARHVAKL